MSKDQLKVKNWEQFQHYRDRNPPWIKLHFALLASEDWVTLDDASKLLAVVCMLIASRNNGMVPNNPAYLKRVAYLDRVPKLKPLIDCGFLEIPQAAASVAQAHDSELQADARPETETESENIDSLSETSSDQPLKKAKTAKPKKQYSEAFESFWTSYPRTPTMSKSEAFREWQKLDGAEQASCAGAVSAYAAYLKTKPDLETVHACRFISQRRFEGFKSEPAAQVDEAVWDRRLNYAREKSLWDAIKWGPVPGSKGCMVPSYLLQPEDGAGWRESGRAA
jgi:hypothetical protein